MMKNSPAWRKWGRRGVELLLILTLLLALRAWQQRDIVSGPAPGLEGVLLDGQPFSLAELRGAPVLVHFWATWCRICALEEDAISAIAREHRVVTVTVYSIIV